MVSSRHMKDIFVNTFPGNESHNTLNGERTSVNKITIKKVLVVHGRVSIDFKDIQDIIVLAVDITAYGNLLFVINFVLNQ